MMQDVVYINALPLPASLVRAIRNGFWNTPKNREVWRSLFPEDQIVQPLLYALGGMEGESKWLCSAGPGYLGESGEGLVPGDIDPARAVLIGDLGPDRLIALDYRESETQPSIVSLTNTEHSCWVRVADDIESFMRLLRLTE